MLIALPAAPWLAPWRRFHAGGVPPADIYFSVGFATASFVVCVYWPFSILLIFSERRTIIQWSANYRRLTTLGSHSSHGVYAGWSGWIRSNMRFSRKAEKYPLFRGRWKKRRAGKHQYKQRRRHCQRRSRKKRGGHADFCPEISKEQTGRQRANSDGQIVETEGRST